MSFGARARNSVATVNRKTPTILIVPRGTISILISSQLIHSYPFLYHSYQFTNQFTTQFTNILKPLHTDDDPRNARNARN